MLKGVKKKYFKANNSDRISRQIATRDNILFYVEVMISGLNVENNYKAKSIEVCRSIPRQIAKLDNIILPVGKKILPKTKSYHYEGL